MQTLATAAKQSPRHLPVATPQVALGMLSFLRNREARRTQTADVREPPFCRARAVHQTFVNSPSDVREQYIRRSAGVPDPFSTRTVGVQDSFLKNVFNHAICLKMFCKSIGAQAFRRLSLDGC